VIVDTLINNAGIIRRSPVLEHSYDDWTKVLAVNLNAGFVLAQELGKGMVERGFGRIIFIASLLSFQGGIMIPAYAASKGAVKQLVMAMSNELAPARVTVNAIAPGYMSTAATKALRDDPVRSRQILERIPAGRWGEPEDVGDTAVFLASRAAEYITGTTIVVDGGWLAR
jgi:2-deoxy-D-gluconate 3-dehydrogenase